MVLANPVFAVAHRGHSSRHGVQESGNTVRHKDKHGYVIWEGSDCKFDMRIEI
jgi:hypothetical protein